MPTPVQAPAATAAAGAATRATVSLASPSASPSSSPYLRFVASCPVPNSCCLSVMWSTTLPRTARWTGIATQCLWSAEEVPTPIGKCDNGRMSVSLPPYAIPFSGIIHVRGFRSNVSLPYHSLEQQISGLRESLAGHVLCVSDGLAHLVLSLTVVVVVP